MKKTFLSFLILGLILMNGCSVNKNDSSDNQATVIQKDLTINDELLNELIEEEFEAEDIEDTQDEESDQEFNESSDLPVETTGYLSVGDKLTIKDANDEVIVWETVLKSYELIKAQAEPDRYIVMLYFDHNYLVLDETGNLSKANPLNISATFNDKELIEQTEINEATNKFENEEDYIYYSNPDPSIPTCSRSFITPGATTSCYAYFKYEGAGDYIIHFNDGKDRFIDYLITVE